MRKRRRKKKSQGLSDHGKCQREELRVHCSRERKTYREKLQKIREQKNKARKMGKDIRWKD